MRTKHISTPLLHVVTKIHNTRGISTSMRPTDHRRTWHCIIRTWYILYIVVVYTQQKVIFCVTREQQRLVTTTEDSRRKMGNMQQQAQSSSSSSRYSILRGSREYTTNEHVPTQQLFSTRLGHAGDNFIPRRCMNVRISASRKQKATAKKKCARKAEGLRLEGQKMCRYQKTLTQK